MRKLFLVLALMVGASYGLDASASVANFNSVEAVYAQNPYAGTYTGKSYAEKMNGKSIFFMKWIPCDSEFTISNSGTFSGSVTVPVVGHSFKIYTKRSVTGPGSYPIFGSFVKKGAEESSKISGNINITDIGDGVLEFTCTAYLNGDSGTESIFNFSGTLEGR